MPQNIYITGMGVISSIGFNVDQTLDAIMHQRTGIQHLDILDSNYRGKLLAGEVRASNQKLLEMLELPSTNKFTRATLLGMVAARQALNDANINLDDGLRTGLVSSTSVGGIDKSENFYKIYRQNRENGTLRHIRSHDCGDSTEHIAVDLGVHHFVTTISTACSSSANAIMMGARLIKNGYLDRVIVGGTDAMTKYTLNGFNSLKILDDQFCKPFDQNRNGLNLGEGAAFLVIESEDALTKYNKAPIAKLVGYGNANDAFHQTASSPTGEGALQAMKKAIDCVEFDISEIDYVNVHGTATYINDLSEGTAMKNLFNGNVPKFSSTKSFTGHTLAASGSIEAIISMLMFKHDFVAPNLNFENAIEGLEICPVTSLQQNTPVNNILSNSFGFGGNCSTLIFSKYRA